MGGTTTVTEAPPTAQELALQDQQLQVGEAQLAAIERQNEFQQQAFEQFEPLVALQQQELERQLTRAQELEPIQDELLQLQLDEIRRGGAATPEQLALIDEVTQQSLRQGEIDIERFQTEATERLADELANSLGLRPTDTPVVRRGEEVAEEAVRQQGSLVAQLQAARANAALNFPLAASQALSGISQFQQGLSQAQQQFASQLSDAAFVNRLRLSQTQGGFGQAASALSPLPFTGPRSRTERNTLGLGEFLGGAGGFLTGLGAVI